MRTHLSARIAIALFAGIALALAAGGGAEALDVIPAAKVLEAYVSTHGDESVLTFEGRQWTLVTDPRSSLVSQLGDGSFHPMNAGVVRDAVRSIGPGLLPADGEILVLPFPRTYPVESSCEGDVIFLSPGIREVSEEHIHTTVVHEIGHLVQHAIVPESSPLWQEYLDLRGLRNTAVHHTHAAHRDRPREIFAEDYRYLFGGELANYSGSIENPDLPLPDAVPGLEDWFRDVVHRPQADLFNEPDPVSFPNPFAGAGGVLQVRFAAGGEERGPFRADVVSVTGRRVAELRDARLDEDAVVFSWNGQDRTGRRVASGIYFVRWIGRPEAGTARVHVLR